MTNPTDAERALAQKLVQAIALCFGDDRCVTPPCACVDDIALALASARAEGYRQTNPADAELARKLLNDCYLHEYDCKCAVGVAAALASAKAEGYRQGQEKMRERCVKVTETWPAGSLYQSECVAKVLRALPITGADK